ncbi:hypothetical protein NDU88_000105 [Pleurodeles waltl]|uniref:Uncharacterized protein n=1 Tax=Pleurodeles waltl TaxID=8319 RepID=A0AAV7S8P7_PLEWA|nr:hypothetical protein NDU88_000105 [Pleurodeles waltl]
MRRVNLRESSGGAGGDDGACWSRISQRERRERDRGAQLRLRGSGGGSGTWLVAHGETGWISLCHGEA